MKFCQAIIVLLLVNVCVAQPVTQSNIDSLKRMIELQRSDTGKINTLCELSFAYYRISPDSGIAYGFEALEIANRIKWQPGIANAHQNIAVNYISLSEYAKALENLLTALAIYEHSDKYKQIAAIYNKLGLVYAHNNNSKALEHYEKSLELYRELKDTNGMAQVYGNIGNVYFSNAKFDEALSAYSLALEHYQKQNDKYGMAQNIQNIAMINTVKANYDEAFKNNELAIEINSQTNNLYGLAISYGNMGVLYMYILRDTITKYKLPYNREAALGRAIDYLQKSIAIAKKLGALDIVQNFYKDLSDAENMLGNPTEALKYYQLYSTYKDSIYSRRSLQKIAYLETERDIYLKDKQIQINKLKLEKRNNQVIFISLGSLLLALSLVVVFRERRKSEKLLLNILPRSVAQRLKDKEHPIADNLSAVSVLFVDMVGFTAYTASTDPKQVVNMLNDIFTIFDEIADRNGLEKIKTIGDCYMAVSGAPRAMQDHARAAAMMALEIKAMVPVIREKFGRHIDFRIGLNNGPAIGGVLGKRKFVYDVWGDTVNTASRMEAMGKAGEIHCTDNFRQATANYFSFTARDTVEVKGKGVMQTWILEGPLT